MKVFLSVLLIIAAGFAIYANSIGGKFLWDDELLVSGNPVIREWSGAADIFQGKPTGFQGMVLYMYRPLQFISYMADYSLWGLDARGYHVTGIIIHILVALSIYRLAYLISKNPLLAFLAGLLFVVNPINTEAVSYISGRADPLSALFIFLGMIFYVRSEEAGRKGYYFLMLLCWALAVLSRESSLVFPLLLLAYHVSFGKKADWRYLLPLFLGILLYAIVIPNGRNIYMSCPTSIAERLPGFFASITSYMRLLLAPIGLHMEYGNRLFAWSDPAVISGIAVSASLTAFALARRGAHGRDGIFCFSVLWFFAALLPYSNVLPMNAYMAEHWLYLPLFGFVLMAAKLFSAMIGGRFRRLSVAAVTCIILAFSAMTVAQNRYWEDPIRFYETTIRYSPGSHRLYYNLGIQYKNSSRLRDAIDCYGKAISLSPDIPSYYNNRANAYAQEGEFDKAISDYTKAIELDPAHINAYLNRATAYQQSNQPEKAARDLEKADSLIRSAR
ncbi:MAG: tetratricopeptide repeat protein [Dehalococcoidales bacterium]